MAQLKDLIVTGSSRFVGTMYGTLVAPTTTMSSTSNSAEDITTKQTRNIIISTNSPSGGESGDIWLKYTL